MADVSTPDEVVALDNHQRSGIYHPFTCPHRGDSKHREMAGDLGALLPTVRGWVCPFCDYTQDWAHEFMKNPSAPRTEQIKNARRAGGLAGAGRR